mmetsp:Transcript_49429/g.44228  ORF Transcript_49429/g.44228 Transcript_49429/m.44228 type:complete len:290 (-) Transcript_49429:39-908(-)
MNEAQQADLLDLELSHDDVDKPVSNDGMDLFSYDDVTEPMLGNNIDKDNNNNNKTNNASSTNIDIGYTGNSDNKTPQNNTDASNAKCWNVQYYQPYFDLDTSDELIRIRKALLPFLAGEFYDKDLDEKPDLYGPFWITTTLAFLMAAMGNFAAYINTNEETVGEWNGDITRISEAATFLYTGSCIVPILLYIVLKTYEENKGLIELLSLYGYSLTPFIISCILCIAPWNVFDWAVVLTAMASSILFLIKNIYKPLADEKKSKPGFYILVIIVGCQFILALALKLYFFRY